MIIVNLIEFSSESSRGLTLPTLYLYVTSLGGGVRDLSLLISLFSFGRLISSTLFGWFSDFFDPRRAYALSLIVSFLSNLLYVFASSFKNHGLLVLSLSRFLVGFGAGNRSVCRSDVARMTSPSIRLRYMTILQATVYMGYALTPGIVSILPYLFPSFNMYTSPGVALCVLNLFVLICVIFVYDSGDVGEGVVLHTTRLLKSSSPSQSISISKSLLQKGFYMFISLNCLIKATLSVFETVTPVLYLRVTDQVDESKVRGESRGSQIASFLFWLGLGTFVFFFSLLPFPTLSTHTGGLVILLLIATLKKQKYSNLLSWCSLLIQGVGCMFGALTETLYSNMFNLLICEILVWSIGSPIAGAVLISSFSVMLGNRNKQGLSMGLIGSAGSLGRIFAPPLNSVLMHDDMGYITFVFFAITSLMGSFGLWMFNRLVERDRKFSNGELKSLLEKKDGDGKDVGDDPLKMALF